MLPVTNQDTLTSQRQIRQVFIPQPCRKPERKDTQIFPTRASINVENAIGKIEATLNTAYIAKQGCVDPIRFASTSIEQNNQTIKHT